MSDMFVMFPMDENGVFPQPQKVNSSLSATMSPPFQVQDLFIYSHGWWTKGSDAMVLYGEYIIEFNQNLGNVWTRLANPPQSSFGLGIHWPSTVSEDMNNLVEQTEQALSYYKMGTRAQQVGSTGVYASLAIMLQSRMNAAAAAGGAAAPLRMLFLGHSFGCRVVCSALQRLAVELSKTPANPILAFFNAQDVRVVLLEPAFKQGDLDAGGNYDLIAGTFPNLKLLITTSQLDYALNHQFPLAEELNNIVSTRPMPPIALGGGMPPLVPVPVPPPQPGVTTIVPTSGVLVGGGPSAATWAAFGRAGAVTPIIVGPGFMPVLGGHVLPAGQRIAVADLTPIHMANLTGPNPEWTWDGKSGSHSDILCPEISNLISDFAFN